PARSPRIWEEACPRHPPGGVDTSDTVQGQIGKNRHLAGEKRHLAGEKRHLALKSVTLSGRKCPLFPARRRRLWERPERSVSPAPNPANGPNVRTGHGGYSFRTIGNGGERRAIRPAWQIGTK